MAFSTQVHDGKVEARARIYKASVEYLPEYVLTGVGMANYWGHWGAQHRFTGRTGVVGAHNCFFQVTIYWGLAGFLALLTVIWQAYRYCPKHCGNDTLALSLLGIVVSVGLMLLIVPNLYSKPFSLGLGLLVGARYWIWPTGSCRRHYPE